MRLLSGQPQFERDPRGPDSPHAQKVAALGAPLERFFYGFCLFAILDTSSLSAFLFHSLRPRSGAEGLDKPGDRELRTAGRLPGAGRVLEGGGDQERSGAPGRDVAS